MWGGVKVWANIFYLKRESLSRQIKPETWGMIQGRSDLWRRSQKTLTEQYLLLSVCWLLLHKELWKIRSMLRSCFQDKRLSTGVPACGCRAAGWTRNCRTFLKVLSGKSHYFATKQDKGHFLKDLYILCLTGFIQSTASSASSAHCRTQFYLLMSHLYVKKRTLSPSLISGSVPILLSLSCCTQAGATTTFNCILTSP